MANIHKFGEITYGVKFQPDTSTLRDLKRELDEISNKAKDLSAIGDTYSESYKMASEAAKDLQKALDISWNKNLGQLNLSKLQKEIEKSYGTLSNFRENLSMIGLEGTKAFNQLSQAIFETQVPIKKSNELLDKMAITFKNTVRYGISSSIFNNFTNSISKAYGYVKNLDQSLNDIRIVSNKSADEMGRLAQQANKAAQALGNTTLDYTKASLIYYQQGLGEQEVAERTNVTLKMANVLGASAQEVSDYMTAIWNNFDDGSQSIEHYADVITALGAATASSSEEIATGLEKFAAIGDTVGLSYEYATSALATVVAKTRQSADTVGTAFKTLFARIQDLELGETLDDGTTLGKYSSALEKVGVNIKDNNGELKQMDQILSEMGEKWQTLSKAQQVALAQTVAGTRQYSQLIALMDNWDEFQTNLGVARNSEGTLQRQEEIYLDSVEAHLNKLQTSWEKFYDAIFDEDSIKLLADGLNSVINLGTTFVNGLGGGLNNLIYTTSMLGSVFSSQLAQGISDAKDNAEALKTSLENIKIQEQLFSELAPSGGIKKILTGGKVTEIQEEIKQQEKILSLKKYISEEEQNQLIQIEKKEKELDSEIRSLQAFLNMYKEVMSSTDKDDIELEDKDKKIHRKYSNIETVRSGNESGIQAIQASSDLINDWLNAFQDRSIEELNNSVQNMSKDDLKTFIQGDIGGALRGQAASLSDAFDILKESEDKWTESDKILAKSIEDNEIRITELQESIDIFYQQINNKKLKKAAFTEDFFEQMDKEDLDTLSDALKTILVYNNDNINALQTMNELLDKNNIKSEQSLKNQIEAREKQRQVLQEAKEAFIESQERQRTIEGTLQLTFSAASSISALFGGIKTLLNDSMSPLEKFGSLLTVASVQGLNLYRTWGRIKDTLPILATQLKVIESTEAATLMIQQGQSAQLTAKVAKQLILNGLKKIQLVIETAIQFISGHWYTLLIAGAAAVYGIVKAYDTWFSKEARLNKEIEKANKALAKTQEAYKEISDTISNYENAQKAIEGLTEGTVEFYNAILKANEESQKLIETLKLAAGTDYTIDTSGRININEDSLKQKQFQEQQKVYTAQSATYKTKADYIEQSEVGGLSGVYKDLTNAINKYNKNHDSDIRINTKLAKDILANESSNEKMYKIVSSIQENTEDIKNQENTLDWTEPIAKVKGNYETLTAELQNYRRLQADALIRASQTQDMVKQYSNLTVKMQQQIQDYVYNKTSLADETYRKNKLANNYGSQNTLVQYNPQDIKDNNYKLPYTGIQATATAQNDKRQSENEALRWFVEEYLKLNKVEGKNTYTYNGENKTSTAIMQEEGYTTEQLISLKATNDAYKQLQTIIQKVTSLDIISGKGLDTVTYLSNARLALENAETSEEFGFVGPPQKGQEGTKTKVGVDFDFNILTNEEFDLLKEEVKKEVEAATSDTEVTLNENLQAVSNYLESLDHHYDSVKRQEQDLANYNNELAIQSDALEASKKALDLYARATINAEKDLNKLSQETARAASEEYSFNKSYNEAVSVFKDNAEAYKIYVNAIKKGEKVSYDVADATAEIADAVQAFGLYLSSEDLVTYYDKVTKLLSGTEKEAEQAYEELSKISAGNSWDEWTQKVIENSDLSKDAITSLKQTIIDLNENSYLDENNLDNLRNYINAAKMSYEELEQFLADNHLVIETEAGKAPALVENPVPTTEVTQTHTLSFDDGINPYTGKKQNKPITWTETTSSTTTPYYTLGEGAEVKKTGSNLKNFKKSIANSKSSGGNNEPDKMDPLKNEIDRYHKVNTQITKIDNSLKKLQSQQEKFVGGELLDNLNKQWNLLNTQIQNYNEKLRIANEEQAELAAKLSAKGVNFNADGTVNNYADAIRTQEAYVNGLIANYNSMSKDAQESYKETVEQAKEDFEQFKTDIDRYDELISSFIPDINQSIQDAIDSQIENNIQKFNIEITVALDMSQATRDWNAWAKRAIEGFSAEDIFGNAQARLKDFYSYFNEGGTGEIQEITKHLENILTELNKQNNGQDNIFGNNSKKGLEELNTYYTKLMQSITDIIELQDELQQDVLDEMDEVQEKFDKQIDSYSYLRELINHDIKVIQMTLGDDAYGEMAKFYDAQQKNYEKQLDFQRQQRDFWYAEMQAAEEGSKEWDAAREKWQNAVNQFNSLLEEGLENAKAKFENAINDIFKKLNDSITGRMGLDYVNTQWDLINKNADRYLDTINATYAIRELEKKYVDSINNSDNVSVQQRLQKVMEEQLTGLKERDRLTQYDVDRANKLYEIELARIALEESQRNKSQMRLRRDSQGNYSYQYVADDDAISEAEDKLNGLYNDLYNFDKERYNDTLNSIYETWSEYQEAMAAAALINDPELRAEKERLIQEQYNELMMQVEEDFQVAKFSLQESFFNDWVNLNDMTLEQFKNLTDNEKDIIMTEFVPTWKNGISEMAEVFAGPEGFAKVTQDAWYAIKDAEQGYSNDIKELENVSKQTFEAIANGQDEAIDKAKDLIKENTELINAYGEELDRVQEVYEKVKQLRQEYEAAEKAAIAATKAAYEFEHKSQEKQISEVQNGTSTTSNAGVSNTSGTGGSSEAANVSGSGSGGNGSPEVGETVNYDGGRYYSTSYGGGAWGFRSGGQVKITIVKSGRPYPIHIATTSGGALGWVREDQISGYDTGGYTGSWDNSGKLAMLHQKELVLNASDTKNMLNAVSVMRSMAYSLGSNLLARLAGVSANGINGGVSSGTVLEQNVHIDATFPNVRNAAEIEEALNNLTNAASQRIYEK